MNKIPRLATGVAVAIALLGALGLGYWWGHSRSARADAMSPTNATTSGERKPLYWYDPMVPNQHFDKPGKSPYMDMELVPKYAEQAEEAGVASIKIDPSIVQNLGVRTTEVERGVLSQPIEAVGSLSFDQRTIAVVQAR